MKTRRLLRLKTMVDIDKPTDTPDLDSIYKAADRLRGVAVHTPLQESLNLSERYGANIFLKREDLQVVRSYKIRGAYNKMASLPPDELVKGVVCASARQPRAGGSICLPENGR